MTTPIDTPEKLATFLAGMGYSRAKVTSAVAVDFPRADADTVRAAVRGAFEGAAEQDAELDRAVERDERAAVEAEHDTSQTMHGGTA